MPDAVGFSPGDAARIARAVKRVESALPDLAGDGPVSGGDVPPAVHHVSIATTEKTIGRYPGNLQLYDPTAANGSRWSLSFGIWVETPNNESLAVGVRYLARGHGYDNGRFVYMTAGCCDTIPGSGSEENPDAICDACPGEPHWNYCTSFPGVTGDCSNGFTDTIVMNYDSPCRWIGQADISTCTAEGFADTVAIQFYKNTSISDDTWELSMNTGELSPIYRVEDPTWDCDSPLTLSLVPGTGFFNQLVELTNWPATITVDVCGGGSGGGNILGLGTESSGDDTTVSTLTMADVEVASGTLLLVRVMECQQDEAAGQPTVTWNSLSLTMAKTIGPTDGTGLATRITEFRLDVPATATADVVVTLDNDAVCCMSATQISGLANNAKDRDDADAGTTGAPTSGPTSATTVAHEYASASVALKNPASVDWSAGDFISGGQDVSVAIGADSYTLAEGYLVFDILATVQVDMADMSQDLWAITLVTYS